MEISRLFKSGRVATTGPLVASLILVGLLFFVWPIPRTISLRDLLLVTCLGLFAWLVYRDRHASFSWRSLRVPFGLYLALSIWIVFVALVVSDETAWTLGEIKGQWLKGMIALFAGGLLGAALRVDHRALRLAFVVVGAVLLLHVLYVDWLALRNWPAVGITRRIGGLAEGPDKSNYLTNILLYFLMAEFFIRAAFQRQFLPIGSIPLGAITLLALFAVYVQNVRNGIAELVVVLGLFTVLAVRESGHTRRRIIAASALALVGAAVVLGYLNLRTDQRWLTFVETIPIALDIENNRGWISEGLPQPRLASGETVDWSNYSRIARIRAGLSLIADRPLGVGFGRNAFGHAVEKKYGQRTAHSHSGIIDLGVGTGVPGVVLWLAFLGALWLLGYRGMRESHGFPALTLLFLTTGYSYRMLVDSTIRDHMLQMFLFLAAFLAVIVANQLHGRQRMASSLT